MLREIMRNLSIKLILTLLYCALVFDLTAHAQKAELVVQTGHSAGISSVAFSPDGKILASGAFDGIIKLWDVQSGKELRTLLGRSGLFGAEWFSPSHYLLSFSQDGKTLASISGGGTIKIWDVESGKALETFSGRGSVTVMS